MVELEHRTGPDADFAWPRLADFALGLWLFASAFLWPHTSHEQMTAVVLGILIVLAAVWAMFAHGVHYLNTLFAIWLFFSTVNTRHASAATAWNNVIVAVLVFALSLLPNTWVVHLSRRRAAARYERSRSDFA